MSNAAVESQKVLCCSQSFLELKELESCGLLLADALVSSQRHRLMSSIHRENVLGKCVSKQQQNFVCFLSFLLRVTKQNLCTDHEQQKETLVFSLLLSVKSREFLRSFIVLQKLLGLVRYNFIPCKRHLSYRISVNFNKFQRSENVKI